MVTLDIGSVKCNFFFLIYVCIIHWQHFRTYEADKAFTYAQLDNTWISERVKVTKETVEEMMEVSCDVVGGPDSTGRAGGRKI